jgi:hypothetical protein
LTVIIHIVLYFLFYDLSSFPSWISDAGYRGVNRARIHLARAVPMPSFPGIYPAPTPHIWFWASRASISAQRYKSLHYYGK